jgi:hypothetical protein
MRIRLAADHDDLNKRFDRIMHEIECERKPSWRVPGKNRILSALHAGTGAGRRLVRSQRTKISVVGAGAAAAGAYLARSLEGPLSLMVPVAGIAIALGGTLLMEPPRRLRPRKRDSMTTPASE